MIISLTHDKTAHGRARSRAELGPGATGSIKPAFANAMPQRRTLDVPNALAIALSVLEIWNGIDWQARSGSS